MVLLSVVLRLSWESLDQAGQATGIISYTVPHLTCLTLATDSLETYSTEMHTALWSPQGPPKKFQKCYSTK